VKIASSPPASGTLEGELLNQLAGQSRQIPFAVFAASLMIAAFAWGHVPPVAIVAWLAIVVVVVMLRRRVLERLPRLDRPDERGRLRIAVAVTLANGVAQGLSLFAFPLLPELERSLHTLVLLGLCAGQALHIGLQALHQGSCLQKSLFAEPLFNLLTAAGKLTF